MAVTLSVQSDGDGRQRSLLFIDLYQTNCLNHLYHQARHWAQAVARIGNLGKTG